MLVLFKPWKNYSDIIEGHRSFASAFQAYQFSQMHRMIMKNFATEMQCKDARQACEEERHSQDNPILPQLGDMDVPNIDNSLNLENALLNDQTLLEFYENAHELDLDDELEEMSSNDILSQTLHSAKQFGIFNISPSADASDPTYVKVTHQIQDLNEIPCASEQSNLMDKLKRNKRPLPSEDDASRHVRRRLNDSSSLFVSHENELENTQLMSLLHEDEYINRYTDQVIHDKQHDRQAINEIEEQRGFSENPEQHLAFRIVGEHVINGDPHQLLLYISGVGGTGKSYVINAISDLFNKCGYSYRLLKMAPTGCAAVLIDGYTIHATTLLPKRSKSAKSDVETLEKIWRNIDYLIIDEISMVSALFLNNINEQLQLAFGADEIRKELPFAGINVIFTGDLGQLPPVGEASMFSEDLICKIPPNIRERPKGQKAVYGAYLWCSITDVIQLKQNLRSRGDGKYINLLNRIRLGKAYRATKPHTKDEIGDGNNYAMSDYTILNSRTLSQLSKNEPQTLKRMHNAPIIVAEKCIRDAFNNELVASYARQTEQEIHFYHSKDYHKRERVPTHLRNILWKLGANVTKDRLGVIPLVPGMKVMITENLAMPHKIVNGCEGTLYSLYYNSDELGHRYPVCANVLVPGCGISAPGLPNDVVPIRPTRDSFAYDNCGRHFSISREQLPLLPAYAYVDYKCQGRSLSHAIIDLCGCRTLQSAYVMLSRVSCLNNLGVLRWFSPNKIESALKPQFRKEFERLDRLADKTRRRMANLFNLEEI